MQPMQCHLFPCSFSGLTCKLMLKPGVQSPETQVVWCRRWALEVRSRLGSLTRETDQASSIDSLAESSNSPTEADSRFLHVTGCVTVS